MKSTNDNKINLEVFELKNHKPVLKYRIVVYDKIILSINNSDIKNGVSKVINEVVKEELKISELTKIEELDYGNSLTHSFEIIKLGWKNLFLNLTDNDLIKLGFKERPKTFWQKLIDFSINEVWIWLERIGFVLAIPLAIIVFRQCSNDAKNQKLKPRQEMQPSQTNSKIDSKDTINIISDSLINNLKD